MVRASSTWLKQTDELNSDLIRTHSRPFRVLFECFLSECNGGGTIQVICASVKGGVVPVLLTLHHSLRYNYDQVGTLNSCLTKLERITPKHQNNLKKWFVLRTEKLIRLLTFSEFNWKWLSARLAFHMMRTITCFGDAIDKANTRIHKKHVMDKLFWSYLNRLLRKYFDIRL